MYMMNKQNRHEGCKYFIQNAWMMSEVEKMYENAGVEKQYYYFDSADGNIYTWELNENGNDKYNMCFIGKPKIKDRVFTPEKQLSLIKWLIQKNFYDERIIRSNYEKTHFYCSYLYDYCESEQFEKFEEALANVFNYFWQDLTESEQEQIRSILNG